MPPDILRAALGNAPITNKIIPTIMDLHSDVTLAGGRMLSLLADNLMSNGVIVAVVIIYTCNKYNYIHLIYIR